MQNGPTPGKRTELARRSLLLGRDPASDLPIEDVEISRRHARLIAQSGGYAIEDLGSMNGTFVNDERISTVITLKPGDRVRFGDQVTFVYEALAAADEAETNAFPVEASAPRPAVARPASKVPAVPEVVVPAPTDLPAEEPMPSRRRARRAGLRLPLFTQPWMMVVGVVVLLGACATIFLLWYIDANLLWCDVFGGLIPACP
jgi:hypothetical protein